MAGTRKSKPTAGGRVEVNDGVTMPEFPQLIIAGWRGTVLETSGTGSKMKVILEWDSDSLSRMPDDVKQEFESQGLMASMACLAVGDVLVVEA